MQIVCYCQLIGIRAENQDNILADRKKIRDKVDAIEIEVAALTTVESILKYTYSFNTDAE